MIIIDRMRTMERTRQRYVGTLRHNLWTSDIRCRRRRQKPHVPNNSHKAHRDVKRETHIYSAEDRSRENIADVSCVGSVRKPGKFRSTANTALARAEPQRKTTAQWPESCVVCS